LRFSKVRPVADSTHWPPIRFLKTVGSDIGVLLVV
jgi:hypothetical protein